jgi:putative membrane protein insertion efficiency factor
MISRFVLGLIRIYQFTFSAIMGNQCRFYPTCSHYTAEAVRRFGAGRGLWLGMCRICRCHPWNPGGHDPVPDREVGEPMPDNWSKPKCCDKTSHHHN